MNFEIEENFLTLREKLQIIITKKLKSNHPYFDDVRYIFDMTDFLLKKEEDYPQDKLEIYFGLKERFKNYCKEIDFNSFEYDRSIFSEEKIEDAGKVLEKSFIEESEVESINERVEEIANLNNYLDCVVETQGQQIDNIYYRINTGPEYSTQVLRELREMLSRRQLRRSFMNGFLYIIMLMVALWSFKFAVEELFKIILD